MDFNLLIKKISQQYKDEMPFVIFSMPDSENVTANLQSNKQLHTVENLTDNGFVFAPFDYIETVFFIPENDSETLQCQLIKEDIDLTPVAILKDVKAKNKYIKLFDKTLDAIKKKRAQKIVISRYEDFIMENFSMEMLIKQLFSSYPTAFKYVWYHSKTGIWCGATPETLVQIENDFFKTMAMAGTQPFTNKLPIIWGPKELDEQQLVTDAITTSLQKVTSVLKVSNPHTHRAGSLLHLRTDITGILKNGKATLTTIAAAVHPTPAVCGSPRKSAKDFILENEGYDREFYTGFLGPIMDNGASASLLVNLRCMKIVGNTARLFIGGGITIASQPNEEWLETQNKMQTMLQVLKPML